MNPFNFNGQSIRTLFNAVKIGLGIPSDQVYKHVTDINCHTGILTTKEGKRYKFVLEEIVSEPRIEDFIDNKKNKKK